MNLFLPVYQRLEDEIIDLSNNIFFDDRQLKVYSLTIGELLIRCAIEIEAISKELYLRLGGNEHPLDSDGKPRDIYYDTDCLDLLSNTWHINKKKIQITNTNMFFSSEKSALIPLHKSNKRGSSSSKWQQAYQAIKHYRAKTIKESTLENLLNALGSLYILNLYYKDESFWLDKSIVGRSEYSSCSKVFTPLIYDASSISMSIEMGDDSLPQTLNPPLEESIYIKKVTDNLYETIHKDFCKATINVEEKIRMTDEYYYLIKNNPTIKHLTTNQLCEVLGYDYNVLIIDELRIINDSFRRGNEKEVVLNKNERIYPTLYYQEFIDSDEGLEYKKHLRDSLKGKRFVLRKHF